MKINSELKMIIGIVMVCAVLLGAFIWFAPKGGNGVTADLNLLVRENSEMTGKFGAKVTLVEFADFECPACATVSPYVKKVADLYKDNPDFNFVYRHFPLSQHANAVISAEASEAAGAQGKFWEMAEMLYKNQAEWSAVSNPTEIFVGYAKILNLDTTKFKSDLDQHLFLSKVQADLKDAVSLNLRQTPSLFLNGVEVTDIGSLQSQIDIELVK
ncbi:MAG: thioredoxin domain-containing protein [Candidatus Paceibacterota bacterium]